MEIQHNTSRTQANKKGLTGSTLKIIALVTMLIDHAAAIILKQYLTVNQYPSVFLTVYNISDIPLILENPLSVLYTVLRLIGRISFPIYCFLLVEGFVHTKNTYRYLIRMALFAAISIVPYSLALYGRPLFLGQQNIFFDLFICLVMLVFLEMAKGKPPLQLLLIILFCFVSDYFRCGYQEYGVVFTGAMYLLRERKTLKTLAGSAVFLSFLTAPLAFLFINRYNGKKGLELKYVFYIIYPVHLLLFYLLSFLVT